MGDGCEAVHGVRRLAIASRMIVAEIARRRSSLIGVLNYRSRWKSSSLIKVVLTHFWLVDGQITIMLWWFLVILMKKIKLFNCDFWFEWCSLDLTQGSVEWRGSDVGCEDLKEGREGRQGPRSFMGINLTLEWKEGPFDGRRGGRRVRERTRAQQILVRFNFSTWWFRGQHLLSVSISLTAMVLLIFMWLSMLWISALVVNYTSSRSTRCSELNCQSDENTAGNSSSLSISFHRSLSIHL